MWWFRSWPTERRLLSAEALLVSGSLKHRHHRSLSMLSEFRVVRKYLEPMRCRWKIESYQLIQFGSLSSLINSSNSRTRYHHPGRHRVRWYPCVLGARAGYSHGWSLRVPGGSMDYPQCQIFLQNRWWVWVARSQQEFAPQYSYARYEMAGIVREILL